MRRALQPGLALALAALGLAAQGAKPPAAPTVIDGIAAAVNGRALTRSEVEDAAWFARFAAQAPPAAAPTAAELATALQHVVDLHLLLQARAEEGYDWAPEADVEAQWKQWLEARGGEAALDAALAADHLTAAEARGLLRDQLTVLDMLDERLGGAAAVGDDEVQKYYDATFVPQARQAGLTPAPLAAVRTTVVEILRQQNLDAAEQQWLQELRRAATIELRTEGGSP